MPRSVPVTLKRPALYSMSAAGASSASAAIVFASSIVFCDATCTAEPPMKSEREPALPKPLLRSVSPITTRMRSIGTWNTSTASCARLVAMPCPMACTAEFTSIMPSGVTVTVTRSSYAMPLVHSRNVAMPRPRSLPLRLDASRRAAKPLQSASFKPWSRIFSNSPQSYTCAIGLVYGN